MIKAEHDAAKDPGYGFSAVLGSEHYYPNGGYVPAAQYGVKAFSHVGAFARSEDLPDVQVLFGAAGVYKVTMKSWSRR